MVPEAELPKFQLTRVILPPVPALEVSLKLTTLVAWFTVSVNAAFGATGNLEVRLPW